MPELMITDYISHTDFVITATGALVQWLKLLHWKVGNCVFEPHARLQVSKKQNVSSLLIRKDSTLWGVQPQIARARISNLVSGGQCHLIHLTIFKRFSWSSLAYMCTKVAYMALHQNGMRSLGPISLKRSYLYVQSFNVQPQIARARISNLVSGGQCHLIHLTIFKRFSWSSLTYMCTKVAYMALHQNGMRSLGPISLKRSFLYVQSFNIKRWDHLKSLTVNERKLW